MASDLSDVCQQSSTTASLIIDDKANPRAIEKRLGDAGEDIRRAPTLFTIFKRPCNTLIFTVRATSRGRKMLSMPNDIASVVIAGYNASFINENNKERGKEREGDKRRLKRRSQGFHPNHDIHNQ